jgi:hypothetical protein
MKDVQASPPQYRYGILLIPYIPTREMTGGNDYVDAAVWFPERREGFTAY